MVHTLYQFSDLTRKISNEGKGFHNIKATIIILNIQIGTRHRQIQINGSAIIISSDSSLLLSF